MNRDEKAAVIDRIAGELESSQAVFAVDYRGITVSQVADLRAKLRAVDATFTVVKNSLTERAADKAGAEALKAMPRGPDRADVRARRRRRGGEGAQRRAETSPTCSPSRAA